jgi:hypothetical protein
MASQEITLQKIVPSRTPHELDVNLMDLTTTTNAETVPQEEAGNGVALDNDDVDSVDRAAIPRK